jgi:rubrerythrin
LVQSRDNALAVVRRALHDEIAGQQFYNDAAFYCIDLWAKELFDMLAKDEEEHTQLLLMEHEALTKDGRWIELEVARASKAKLDVTELDLSNDRPDEPLFPPRWSVEAAVDRRADDLAALAFGIRMEERAIDLYDQAGRMAEDRMVREAYDFLVEEEIRHREQLRGHWEKLSGMAWEESPDRDSQKARKE